MSNRVYTKEQLDAALASMSLAERESFPGAIVRRWIARFGEENAQKLCISFGADSRFASSGSASSNSSSSKSASSSSSRSSSSSSENAESDSSWPQDSEFPEGFDESGDNGHVYVDDDYNPETGEWGNVKGIVDILRTDCNCDDRIYKYFVGLVGKGGKYNVFTQNCRDFSRMVFEKFRGECGK